MEIIISLVLLFLGIAFLVLLHVCITGRVSRREGRGMSIDDLEKLPCYDYVAKDNGSSPVICAVCLENLTTGDKCRMLPLCKHSFHAQCVDTWLLKTPICPICRASASSQGGSHVVGNNDHFIEPNSEFRDSQTATGSQADDIMVQLRESSQVGPSRHVGRELRENPTLGSYNSGYREVESREHQTASIENQMTSATSLSHAVEFAAVWKTAVDERSLEIFE